MTELIGNVTMRELLIFELGIYAEVNASTDNRILDKKILKELSYRYHQTYKQIQDAYDRLNQKYVEVIIK